MCRSCLKACGVLCWRSAAGAPACQRRYLLRRAASSVALRPLSRGTAALCHAAAKTSTPESHPAARDSAADEGDSPLPACLSACLPGPLRARPSVAIIAIGPRLCMTRPSPPSLAALDLAGCRAGWPLLPSSCLAAVGSARIAVHASSSCMSFHYATSSRHSSHTHKCPVHRISHQPSAISHQPSSSSLLLPCCRRRGLRSRPVGVCFQAREPAGSDCELVRLCGSANIRYSPA